ncbi:MAG: helix-turn-helix domain-containing protein [Pseudomonadota bacterium]
MFQEDAEKPRLRAAIFNGNQTAQSLSIRLDGKSGYHKLAFVTRGIGSVMIDGNTTGFGPNTLIFIPDHCPHALRHGVNAHMITFAISIDAQLPLPVNPNVVPVERSADIVAINQLFDTAFHELNSGDMDAQMAVESYIGLMTVHFNRLSQVMVAEETASASALRLMRRFAYMVEEKFHQGATLEDIAAALDVTPTHLTRVCQALNSKSASHFVQDRILGEAKFRLIHGQERIQSIAEDLGFKSAAYFSRFFQGKTKKTPKDFRKYAQAVIESANHFDASEVA